MNMKQFRKFKVAVIGCGMISDTYFGNLCSKDCGARHLFEVVEVVGCSDIKPERSKAKSEKYGIKMMTNEEIYADKEIDIVLNLTYHTSHFEVSKNALLAGKHVYSEKMMAITFEEGKELMRIAKEKGLLFCAAPDTFLGSAGQTAREAFDAGLIGTPVVGNASVIRGYHHERYRAETERRFAFMPGGGIMYDMGCYYFGMMINLLGPIKRVCGFSQTRGACDRVYANPQNPEYGKVMKIETPNNVGGVMLFENGTIMTFTTSSESINCTNNFVIHGTKGKLTLHDPNNFGGNIALCTAFGDEKVLPVSFPFSDNCRGLGLADMCYAIANGREPRASGERALHMLEAATAIMECADGDGRIYDMTTSCTRPAPFEGGLNGFPEMLLDLDI